MKKTLYVHRKLINGKEFVRWAKRQGFKNILDADDLHVTIAFSKKQIDWTNLTPKKNTLKLMGGTRSVIPLGNEGAVVLKFTSNKLQEGWQYYIDHGASWDWDSYKPHVSITYDGTEVDLKKVKPFTGDMIFGPEIMKEVDLEWKGKVKKS